MLLWEGLDRLILQFRRSHPTFVADYQNARVIVDQAATRETAKNAVVLDTTSGQPQAQAA